MGHWITSKTELPTDKADLLNNSPVDLDAVESFNKTIGNSIKFYYHDNTTIIEWHFAGISARDAEYNRIIAYMLTHSCY